MGIIIPYNPYLFTLLGTCVLSHFKLQLLATCFLYILVTSQQMLIQLVLLFTLCLHYKYLWYHLKLLQKVATLHSKVKYSLTQMYLYCHFSLNFKGRLLYYYQIWFYNFMQNHHFGYELCYFINWPIPTFWRVKLSYIINSIYSTKYFSKYFKGKILTNGDWFVKFMKIFPLENLLYGI